MESLYVHASSIRDEWYCRKGSMQSQRRECCCYLHNVQDLLSDGKLRANGDLESLSVGQLCFSDRKWSIIGFLQEGPLRHFCWPGFAGVTGVETYSLQTLRKYKKLHKNNSKDSTPKKFWCRKKETNFISPLRRWFSQDGRQGS